MWLLLQFGVCAQRGRVIRGKRNFILALGYGVVIYGYALC